MTLIKSISGIRGTIGGKAGQNLTPIDIVECTAAYAKMIQGDSLACTIVVGRDARISGDIVSALVIASLQGMGIDVIDLGLSTTPSVEMYVLQSAANGGIIITASHNPEHWNALKFLNDKGEFISADQGNKILDIISKNDFHFAEVRHLGKYKSISSAIQTHIESILDLPLVDVQKVKSSKFKIVVDCINSTGAISVVPLLALLGCEIVVINGEMNGQFAHNPEPLAQHLQELCKKVVEENADLGISVDPDVDRLVFVMENGILFGEEYSLVAIADYVLSKTPGNTVSNLSSTRALNDVTVKYGQQYNAAAVGEVNVVAMMKETNAVIGGEGNGGIIYPELHYGRDALVGIAFMLTYLSEKRCSLSEIRRKLPIYEMAKDKIELSNFDRVESILNYCKTLYAQAKINTIDGVKIELPDGWIHLRQSNTEPIIRIYSEATNEKKAMKLCNNLKEKVLEFLK